VPFDAYVLVGLEAPAKSSCDGVYASHVCVEVIVYVWGPHLSWYGARE
jgi:hypothetical protein